MNRKGLINIEWDSDVFKRLIAHLVSLPNCAQLMECKFWPVALLAEKTYCEVYPPLSFDRTRTKIHPKACNVQKLYDFMNNNIQYIQTAMKNFKEGHMQEIIPPVIHDRLQSYMEMFYAFWQYHHDLVKAEKNHAKMVPMDIINAIFKQLYNREPTSSDKTSLQQIKIFGVRYLVHLKVPHVMPWDVPHSTSVGDKKARNFIAKMKKIKRKGHSPKKNKFDPDTDCPICRQDGREKINVIFVGKKSNNKLFVNHIGQKHLPLECVTCCKHFKTLRALTSTTSCCEHPLICEKPSEKPSITKAPSEDCKFKPAAANLTAEKIVARLGTRKRHRKEGYEKDTNLYPVKKHCIIASGF